MAMAGTIESSSVHYTAVSVENGHIHVDDVATGASIQEEDNALHTSGQADVQDIVNIMWLLVALFAAAVVVHALFHVCKGVIWIAYSNCCCGRPARRRAKDADEGESEGKGMDEDEDDDVRAASPQPASSVVASSNTRRGGRNEGSGDVRRFSGHSNIKQPLFRFSPVLRARQRQKTS